MRLLVTGGTGFIGSHFIQLALSEGHEVVAPRRAGSRPTLDLPLQPRWIDAGFSELPDDEVAACDALYHFAAVGVSPRTTDWRTAFQVNVTDSVALCEQAIALGVSRLIACGTCFEFGAAGANYERIPADTPLAPMGPYSTSKAAFSLALTALARTNRAECVLLRPFHLYGEGQHETNLWPALKIAALAGADFQMTAGEQIRDYLPVEQGVRRFLDVLSAPVVPGRMMMRNIGSGSPTTLKEFASHWWKHWGATGKLQIGALPYRENEVMRFVPEIDPLFS